MLWHGQNATAKTRGFGLNSPLCGGSVAFDIHVCKNAQINIVSEGLMH